MILGWGFGDILCVAHYVYVCIKSRDKILLCPLIHKKYLSKSWLMVIPHPNRLYDIYVSHYYFVSNPQITKTKTLPLLNYCVFWLVLQNKL